jgi:hypothetical protein
MIKVSRLQHHQQIKTHGKKKHGWKGKQSNDVIWSKEQMESLLNLYEQETELWDIPISKIQTGMTE